MAEADCLTTSHHCASAWMSIHLLCALLLHPNFSLFKWEMQSDSYHLLLFTLTRRKPYSRSCKLIILKLPCLAQNFFAIIHLLFFCGGIIYYWWLLGTWYFLVMSWWSILNLVVNGFVPINCSLSKCLPLCNSEETVFISLNGEAGVESYTWPYVSCDWCNMLALHLKITQLLKDFSFIWNLKNKFTL